MILGRCYLLQTVRHATALSKKRCARHSGASFHSVQTAFSPIDPRHLNRPGGGIDLVSLSSARMASTSKDDSGKKEDSGTKKTNRLALEKSPYLLQHATNPVNWYPWGDEALELAKNENKMIFLSVGYSTCHWCHVMEKESFKNEAIAEIMNKYYVNIKVDREERPDIDRIYMNFVQADTGHGGWPMSVFLAPNLNPITGGTYIPPEDMYGYRGFKTILLELAKQWEEHKDNMMKVSVLKSKKISFYVEYSTGRPGKNVPPLDCGELCVRQLSEQYEPEFGGFGGVGMQSTKFPEAPNLNFLLHMYARKPDQERSRKCLHMCAFTLRKIAYGGIHDHVGQGFARYSTDGQWHVPHFEKMLYDQAQLMQCYADAFVATKDAYFAEIVDDIATYVTRDLRHEEGGFYSAEDADSYPKPNATAKKEGAFYVWTAEEIETHLGDVLVNDTDTKLSDIFSYHFNTMQNGNVNKYKDPHGELTKKNVLIMFHGFEKTAEHFNLTVEVTKEQLKKACSILYKAREARPRPHLDDKIITAWNGLMISGMARGGMALGNKQYIEHAVAAAKFIEQYLFISGDAKLLHSCYRGENNEITQIATPVHGFLEDYAFLIKGLLDLYEATFDEHWLEFAEQLQDTQDSLFWDKSAGGYFSTTDEDPSLIHRLKDVYDRAEPGGNSVAAENLLRLASALDRTDLRERAGNLFKAFSEWLVKNPAASPLMISALVLYHDSMTQIYIAGQRDAKDTDELLGVVYKRLIPGRVLLLVDHQRPENILFRKNEIVTKMKPQTDRATAYVCRHRTCSLPVTTPDQLSVLLDQRQ